MFTSPPEPNGRIPGQPAKDELLRAEQALEDKTRELAQSLALLRATLESTSNAILAVDRQGAITDFNQNFVDMWRLDRADLASASHARILDRMGSQLQEDAAAFRAAVTGIEQSQAESLDLLEVEGERFIERFSKPQTIAGEIVGRVWSFREITARKRAEAALARSEARLRSTFNQAAVGMSIAGLDGRFLIVNPRLAQMLGYSREELQGRSFLDLTHPADVAVTQESVRRLLAGEIPEYMLEKRYLTRPGEVMWGRTTVTVQRADDGTPLTFIGVVEDVTQRRQAEAELHAREHELSVIYSNVSEVIFYLSVEPEGFRFLSVNAAFLTATGLASEQVIGRLVQEVIPEPSLSLVLGHYREAIDQRRTVAWEETTEYPAGSRVGFVTVTPIFDAELCINLIGTVHDISVRKRAEIALREESRALELLNSTGTTLASNLDLETLLQAATDAATELTGAEFGAFFYSGRDEKNDVFTLYTVSGAPRAAFDRFGQPGATALFGPTLRGDPSIRIDDVLEDPRYGTMAPQQGMPPSDLPVRSYLAAPVVTRSGEVLGGLFFGHSRVGVFNERTERIAVGIAAQAAVALDNARLFASVQKAAAERELLLERERLARAHAERMSDVKDEFVATLSHELRTPLSAILGWAYILRSAPPNAEQLREGLETIERNARVQTQLIEDLLDMSRIVSGKVRLDIQPLNPIGFINAALETVRPAAEAKSIRIERVIDPAAGPISGDPNRLQQVLWNLLSNAIKFTPRNGKLQVVVERVNSHIEIHVADTGIGIEPDFIAHVFERFRQADSSTSRRHGGLGLGLAIVKHLVELHGGTVQATSEGLGRGATFTVALPLAVIQRRSYESARAHPRSATALPLAFTPVDLSGLKVLVVDDEADARELIRHLLAECTAEVFIARSAEEALAAMDREQPDVLVSDIGMPGTDGFELLRCIRARGEGRGGKIPAIALSAFARSEDRTRALRAGFQVYVSKPVEAAELVASVASVSGRGMPAD